MEALGDESKLRVVEEPSRSAEGSASSSPDPKQPRARQTGRVWLWLLLGLFLGLAVAYQQYSRAEGLVSQVQTLNAALGEAERQIQAYDTRFRDVRVRVSELDQRVDALKVLVETDPLQPIPSVTSDPKTGVAPQATGSEPPQQPLAVAEPSLLD